VRGTAEIMSHGYMLKIATTLKLQVLSFNYVFIVEVKERHGQETLVINLEHLSSRELILIG
jgi:hypothetical protein